ncbi:hypothetical protein CLV63_11514 [Murinocardiopsis flavida]|uniref:Uncharacterized protein n=1 Tax=Murinocardiopsis flavida TaxID=645275 RepID=A0A2P8DDQ4_9ACTN|nr:hypothetical protein [Murinocardiopsis flavida]PSK95354.1 hypothetical protein CLV63_11514 [Murinocardiopsis flavida]
MGRRATGWLYGIAGALIAGSAVLMIVWAWTRGEVTVMSVLLLVPAYLLLRAGRSRLSKRGGD